jgi:RNA polymerase sigma factor (sigma-70 family)
MSAAVHLAILRLSRATVSGRAKGSAEVTTVADIVGRAAVCDDRAWEDLIRLYGKLLTAIACQYRLGLRDGDDAAQMTWLGLLQNAHRLRDPERVAAWLSTTMRRNCMRIVRRRRHEVLSDEGVEWGARADPDAVDERVLRAERDRLLWESVNQLPPRQREVVTALFVNGLSYGEVAASTAMPVGAIGPTRRRALRRLERMLTTKGVAGPL